MAFRLSTGTRNIQLGLKYNPLLYGEDVTVSDVSSAWTAAAGTITGNHDSIGTVSRDDVLQLSAAVTSVEQEVTVVPGHTYQFTMDFCNVDATATDGLLVDIGSTTGADDIFSGINFDPSAQNAWDSMFQTADETLYSEDTADDAVGSLSTGACVFTAGATTDSVFITIRKEATNDIVYIDNVRLTDLSASIKDMFADCMLRIYSGTQPASADTAPTGTLLVTIDSNANATGNYTAGDGLTFGTPASATLSKNSGETWSGVCTTGGTAGWGRFVTPYDDGSTSTVLPRMDIAIGTSGAQINFSTTSFVAGTTQSVTGFSIVIPTA